MFELEKPPHPVATLPMERHDWSLPPIIAAGGATIWSQGSYYFP